MSCGKHRNMNTNCVMDVVQFINDLQNAVVDEDCVTSCLNPVLGSASPHHDRVRANTRPFVLYTSEGEPFEAKFCHHHDLCNSIFFRVEAVEDNCALLQVLKEEEACCGKFCGTQNCITVDLRCFCAIQCFPDFRL